VFSVGHVFKSDEDVRELFTGRESKEWVLLTAIGLEKESIVFYVGLRDLVPEEFGRDKIDAIIREEKKHIVILTHELTAVKNLAQSAEPDPGP
jgi:rubrerythrin